MLPNLFTISQKEIKDAIRDPSSIFAAILYSLLGPIMLLVILNIAASVQTSEVNRHIYLSAVDTENIISKHLQADGFIFDETAKVKVTLTNQAIKNLSDGKQADVIIEGDLSEINRTVIALEKSLYELRDKIRGTRLEAVNLDIKYVTPIKIQKINNQTSSFLQNKILGIFILIFLLPVGFTAMSLTIDMTAGERERLSLEPLLAQPITPLSIIIGKWLVANMLTFIGCLISISLSILILEFMPSSDLDAEVSLNLASGIKIFLILIPLCMMMTAIQLAFALYAKSYKEGITYLGILALPPVMIPLLSNSFLDKFDYLPIFWEISAIKNILLNNTGFQTISFQGFLITVVITAFCIYYAQYRLKQEAILT